MHNSYIILTHYKRGKHQCIKCGVPSVIEDVASLIPPTADKTAI